MDKIFSWHKSKKLCGLQQQNSYLYDFRVCSAAFVCETKSRVFNFTLMKCYTCLNTLIQSCAARYMNIRG